MVSWLDCITRSTKQCIDVARSETNKVRLAFLSSNVYDFVVKLTSALGENRVVVA